MRLVCLVAVLLLAGCSSQAPSAPAGHADGPVPTAGDEPAPQAHGQTATSSPSAQPKPSQSPGLPPQANGTANETKRPWSLAVDGWATLDAALLRPGSRIENAAGTRCSINFLFTNPGRTKAYAGTAAHCFDEGTPSGPSDANPCDNAYAPLDAEHSAVAAMLYNPTTTQTSPPAPVPIGRFVYSSFNAMRDAGETDVHVCGYQDFALIELDDNATRLANPAVWRWGGPTALHAGLAATGDHVYTFGGTSTRSYPLEATKGREGVVNRIDGTGSPVDPWSAFATFPGSCIPGDSGSPVLDPDGRALGVLVRDVGAVLVAGTPVCIFSYLEPALAYMVERGGQNVVLATADVLDGGLPIHST